MNNKKHFSFLEMIGSVVMLIIDPSRNNSTKYLNKKYNSLNRTIGIIVILTIIIAILLLWIELAVDIFGSPIAGS